MSIYISCHHVDDLFAAEISAYMASYGFKIEPLTNQYAELASNDVVIVILRPEHVRSVAYSDLINDIDECTVIPLLRSPIDISDWNASSVLSPLVDFTNYREEQTVIAIKSLAQILSASTKTVKNSGNPLENYSNQLGVETRRQFSMFWLLETINYTNGTLDRCPIYDALSNTTFDVFSANTSQPIGSYRRDKLSNITKSRESCFVICDDFDCSLIAAYMTELDRQLFASSGNNTPALLLDITNWYKNLTPSEWLNKQLGLKEPSFSSEIVNNKFTIYVYGFGISTVSPVEFEEHFNKWWNTSFPPLNLVITCPSFTYSQAAKIKIGSWSFEQLQELCTKYPDRRFAKYIASNTVDQDQQLSYFCNNPLLAVALLSVQFQEDFDFQNISLKEYSERLINNLWNILSSGDSDLWQSRDTEIAKIAAIMTEKQKSFIGYVDALNYVRSEALLQRCIDVGLFVQTGSELRFSSSIIQVYFSALALKNYGVPSHLPAIKLNSQSARIPQRWDQAIILASYLVASSDKFIRRVADNDPLLALKCLTSNNQSNPELYSYIIDRNLSSFVDVGDFRTDFAKLLHHIDNSMAQAILIEVLRNGTWEVRQYAYQTLLELKFPLKIGLENSLTHLVEDDKPSIGLALKRMSVDALPTLFHLLYCDDDMTRCNAIWALGELADKASGPALVTLLSDHSLNVALQAAEAIARIQDVTTLPYLAAHLRHRHIHMKNAVLNTVISLYSQQPQQVIKAIKKLDPRTRREMVLFLSHSEFDKIVVDLFLEFSRDEDIDVRIAALQALAPIDDSRVTARFKECVGDMSKSKLNKSTVNDIVSRFISNVPHGDGQSNILGRKKPQAVNSSQVVKARLLNAKAQQSTSGVDAIKGNDDDSERDTVPEDAYVADIITQLRSRKWDTSNNAARMLREYMKNLHGNVSSIVINQVLETLNDDDWVIRWTGVESLGWAGNIHVVPHLIQRLSDSNWKIRVAAIRALTEIKDNSAITGLSKLSTDANTVVREAAAEALGFLDGKMAIEGLEAFAVDTEDFVRLASVESLGRINDKVAEAALVSALKDTSEHVRWAAANGLSRIADANLVPLLIPSLSDIGGPYWEQKRICDVIIDILKRINTEEAKKAIAEWQTQQSQ